MESMEGIERSKNALMVDSERRELVVLRARLIALDLLCNNYEECKKEKEILRQRLIAYDEALLRLQNKLECFPRGDAESDARPASGTSQSFVTNLLAEYSILQQRVVELQVSAQEKGYGDYEEHIGMLQVENDALRTELETARPILESLQDKSTGSASMSDELSRVHRIAKTKTAMCDALTSELSTLREELKTARHPPPAAPAAASSGSRNTAFDHAMMATMMDSMNPKITSPSLQVFSKSEHQEAQSLQQRLQDAEEGQRKIAQTAKEYKDELDRLRKEMESKTLQIEQLQQSLILLQNDNQKERRDMAVLRINHARVQAHLEEEIKKFHEPIERTRGGRGPGHPFAHSWRSPASSQLVDVDLIGRGAGGSQQDVPVGRRAQSSRNFMMDAVMDSPAPSASPYHPPRDPDLRERGMQ